ncbi:MAG: hypothetical protein WC581_09705 [Thermodesulfovibrionales bacterium]
MIKLIKKYWADPVWSKVIAGIILAILTTIYLLLESLVTQVSFATAFFQLLAWLKSYSRINNLVIVSVIFFIVYLIYKMIVTSKKRNSRDKPTEEELTTTVPKNIGYPFERQSFRIDRANLQTVIESLLKKEIGSGDKVSLNAILETIKKFNATQGFELFEEIHGHYGRYRFALTLLGRPNFQEGTWGFSEDGFKLFVETLKSRNA